MEDYSGFTAMDLPATVITAFVEYVLLVEKCLNGFLIHLCRGAQPVLTWDLLLHFPVSGDLPIWQSCETKQTEPMLVGLSVYLSYTYNLHLHNVVNKKHNA